jgi:hypothetical protein
MIFGGKKAGTMPGEIDVSSFDFLKGSVEFARLWNEPDGPQTCIIEPRNLGADPALFGMAMVDAIRHGAKAYAQAVGIAEQDALTRIWQGFDAERTNPTDTPVQINPDGSIG